MCKNTIIFTYSHKDIIRTLMQHKSKEICIELQGKTHISRIAEENTQRLLPSLDIILNGTTKWIRVM